jgi:hypothetical protein
MGSYRDGGYALKIASMDETRNDCHIIITSYYFEMVRNDRKRVGILDLCSNGHNVILSMYLCLR